MEPAPLPEDPAIPTILVSACLAGESCRYDGRAKPDPEIVAAAARGEVITACAEVLGGMSTPSEPAEITGGDGHDVLRGTAQVLTASGDDVTEQFVRGARQVAELVAVRGVTRAILQSRSPSCGHGQIYDGTHSGTMTTGDGVLSAALQAVGCAVESARRQPSSQEAPGLRPPRAVPSPP